MNKDIIYIDVEDDITAIIGKVKDAKEKIVALVPPKRIGVLQSAVNLRLLARAAGQADKRLVLITNNAALTALASAAKLPIAKNLQSKPEIAQIPALDIDDGNDVIDGAQLPVGDLQRTADIGTAALSDPAVDEIVRSDATPLPIRAAAPTDGQSPRTGKVKKGTKVPNFNKFRKKLLLIIAAAVLLLGFAVWALFFAPRATVIISARTTESSMNKQVVMGANVDTSASAGTLKTTLQQVKNDVSGSFDATGKKDVGEKATGTVQFTSDSFSSLLVGIDIPAGTELSSSSGNVYVTDTSVTLTTSGNTKTTGITAVKNGTSYNGASGSMTG
ncbi:MAG: baseplate J/gp47 family protein, partial [Candidatus Saccharimonadales bacterium]